MAEMSKRDADDVLRSVARRRFAHYRRFAYIQCSPVSAALFPAIAYRSAQHSSAERWAGAGAAAFDRFAFNISGFCLHAEGNMHIIAVDIFFHGLT